MLGGVFFTANRAVSHFVIGAVRGAGRGNFILPDCFAGGVPGLCKNNVFQRSFLCSGFVKEVPCAKPAFPVFGIALGNAVRLSAAVVREFSVTASQRERGRRARVQDVGFGEPYISCHELVMADSSGVFRTPV